MESYKHEIIDLQSRETMIGLKNGILTMSVNQRCKLWIPQRLTAYIDDTGNYQKEEKDILIEITLINIIRSDVYKDTTYTNDVVAMGDRSRRHRANTVSMVPPPMTPMPLPASVPRTSTVKPTTQPSPNISPPLSPNPNPSPNPLKTRPSIDLTLDDENEHKTLTSASTSTLTSVSTSDTKTNGNGNVNVNGNNKQKRKKKTGKYSVVINNIDEEEKKTGKHLVEISEDNHFSQSSGNSLDLRFPVPDLQNFGGHINHQTTDLALSDQDLDMKLLISEIGQNSHGPTMNLSTPRMDIDDGNSFVIISFMCFVSLFTSFSFLFCFFFLVFALFIWCCVM